jgi:hypothetical protein
MESIGLPMQKNYRFAAIDFLGVVYMLKWKAKVGWTIPVSHPFWHALHTKLLGWSSFTEDML